MVWYFGNVILYFIITKWLQEELAHLKSGNWAGLITCHGLNLIDSCVSENLKSYIMGSSAPILCCFTINYVESTFHANDPCKTLTMKNHPIHLNVDIMMLAMAVKISVRMNTNQLNPSIHIWMDGWMDIERCGFESRMWEVLPCEDYMQDYPPKPRSDHDHFHHNVVLFVSVNIAAESSFYANDPCGLGVCLADGTSNVFLNARYKFGRHPS